MNHPSEKDLQEAVVFIDYQNLYNDARRAFAKPSDSASFGQVHPIKLANLLVSREPPGISTKRTLEEVRVYRGRPDSTKEPKTYGAHMRQCDAWEKAGIRVMPRPLRYPYEWPASKPEEKGIDVQIAVDIVTMGINAKYDVAILVSTDTDLLPPLEAFFALPFGEERKIETAAYRSPIFKKVLRPKDHHVWCHLVEEDEYREVWDNRDYNIKPR